jgi:hypothetical protein
MKLRDIFHTFDTVAAKLKAQVLLFLCLLAFSLQPLALL